MFDALKLKGRVSAGNDADPKDVLALKKSLAKIGLLAPDPKDGLNGFVDRDQLQAVKAFQEKRGLRVDGVVNPDGPTLEALNVERRRGSLGLEPDSTTRGLIEKKRILDEERRTRRTNEGLGDVEDQADGGPEKRAFKSPHLVRHRVDKPAAVKIVGGVLDSGRKFPPPQPTEGPDKDQADVNVGGFRLSPKVAGLFERVLKTKSKQELVKLRRELAKEMQRTNDTARIFEKKFPFDRKARAPEFNREGRARADRKRRGQIDVMQHAEFAKIIALRLDDRPGLESLDPEEREERIVEILEVLDDRVARSRWITNKVFVPIPPR